MRKLLLSAALCAAIPHAPAIIQEPGAELPAGTYLYEGLAYTLMESDGTTTAQLIAAPEGFTYSGAVTLRDAVQIDGKWYQVTKYDMNALNSPEITSVDVRDGVYLPGQRSLSFTMSKATGVQEFKVGKKSVQEIYFRFGDSAPMAEIHTHALPGGGRMFKIERMNVKYADGTTPRFYVESYTGDKKYVDSNGELPFASEEELNSYSCINVSGYYNILPLYLQSEGEPLNIRFNVLHTRTGDYADVGGLSYSLSGDEATVIKASEKIGAYTGDIDIPAKITAGGKNYTVSAIDAKSFMESDITGVKIPGTVGSIGPYAFDGCARLAEISLAEGLKEIGMFAFEETPIECVEFPTSLEDAGYYSFRDCKSLSRVSMPATCKTNGTFTGCDKLLAIQDAEYTATEMSFGLLDNISWTGTSQAINLAVKPRYAKTYITAGTDGRFTIEKNSFVGQNGTPATDDDTYAWGLEMYGPGGLVADFKIEWNVTGGCADAVVTEYDGPTEWYNLQGVRVDNPGAGVYIRRRGSEVRKVLVP